jgi:hypothetical protein
MTFPSSGSDFLDNEKDELLYRNMVEIAKSGGYSSLEKSLIYGCYVHVLQDNYADYVAQPSIFGYGNNFLDAKYGGDYILYDAESLYEMFFAVTSIPNQSDWNRIINKVFDDKFNFLKEGSVSLETYKTFLEADVLIDIAGNGKYDAIEGLCSALNQQQNVTSFNYEGMKPFIHMWGIILYELYKVLGENKINKHITAISKNEKEQITKMVNNALSTMSFRTPEEKETQVKVWKRIVGKSFMTKREAFTMMGFLRKIVEK